MKKKTHKRILPRVMAAGMAAILAVGSAPELFGSLDVFADTPDGTGKATVEEIQDGYRMSNEYFTVETGKYGQITSLKIVGDEFDTNYVMNEKDNPQQATTGHQWMGELIFQTKGQDETEWTKSMTNSSDSGRTVQLQGDKVVVTYENAQEEEGIKDFKVTETYALVDDKLQWDIHIENTENEPLIIGDLGLPLAFREYWMYEGEAYETSTLDHSFVGKDSSYIYITRPSGIGKYLLMTPEADTGAGFEYQDHWVWGQGREEDEKTWCMDQGNWANGLNVFYIHSDVIKSENKGYLENTSLTLDAGESKTYTFNFSAVNDENEMKQTLYEEDIIDAVAVPGMAFSKDMPAQMYLHTKLSKDEIDFAFQCPHNNGLHTGTNNINTSDGLPCDRENGSYAVYKETKMVDGEQYHIYDIAFGDLGQNNIIVNYTYKGQRKQTVLQFYMMDSIEDALALHSDFIVDKTQWDAPGSIQDKVFDDWMMDTKSKRGEFGGYWGWGDDWGYVHGEFLAEMNSYTPVAKQVSALDEYLDTAIWNGLLQEQQEDYLIHDFLMKEPNTTPTYRGFAYPHIYNTYFSMYKIAQRYPDLIDYKEETDTYLLRAYHIMKALYSDGVGYNWATGLMGEQTTPDIISALEEAGYEEEAASIQTIMEKKYNNFKNEKYPYVSEYPYDNTSEEAIYTLGKMFEDDNIMSMVDEKTRACRGVQPIWYHYGNPTTICGENWFNFQYTASLAGYCMDDWLRVQSNGMSSEEMGQAARMNYAGKLANLTVINSGQIDSDPENIGTVAWTYQSEMGNETAFGTGGGKLHNGWRQMSGEADLALFGALQILSADVAVDPIFGLVGYGCEVEENNNGYTVTPLDGLHRRLNLINDKVSVELQQDKYNSASVSKDGSSLTMELLNVTGAEHDSDMNVTGMKAGTYQVAIDGKVVGSFETDGKETTISIPLKAEGGKVTISGGELLKDTVVTVNAGEDQEVTVSDEIILSGTAKDSAWLHRTPDVKWTVEKRPLLSNVTFANDKKAATKVTVDRKGTYIFKLSAKGYTNSANDTVTVKVTKDGAIPEVLASYDFEEGNLDTENRVVKDISGEGYDAQLKGQVTTGEGKDGNAVIMNGEIGGYVKFPSDLASGVKRATIAVDVNAAKIQNSGARLIEFGDMDGNYLYVSFVNGNELSLNITNIESNKLQTALSGITLLQNNWKNVAVTLEDTAAILYVDGMEAARIKNPGFTLDKLGNVQRNFLGRSQAESTAWFNGSFDNFVMLSNALSAREMQERFGTEEEVTVKEVVTASLVTAVDRAPNLPEKVKVIYSNGTSRQMKVTWELVTADQYGAAGDFTVNGTVTDIDMPAKAEVSVIVGQETNLALSATPTAIFEDVNDLGGAAGLNDGYDPVNSNDKSHGVWHNWGGAQNADAWVQYTWDKEVLLTGSDAYYFTDGNFAPANVRYQYLSAEGEWMDISDAAGLGTELNQYNYTEFPPISTTAVRMWMTPKTLACGVIEWKVYGYSDTAVVDKSALRTSILKAEGLDGSQFTDGLDALKGVLTEAKEVLEDSSQEQSAVDAAAAKLVRAMKNLTPKNGNYAFSAGVFTSFVSSWESLNTVNDGKTTDGNHYGSWGNESSFETVTYTWDYPVEISSSNLFIWNDGGGIHTPAGYTFEYMDSDGVWKEVTNPVGLGLEPNTQNITTFDPIATKAFRVTLHKDANDSNGVGLWEWEVFGSIPNETVDKQELQNAVEEAKQISNEDQTYSTDSWRKFIRALTTAEALLADNEAAQYEITDALQALQTAKDSLTPKVVTGVRNLAPAAAATGSAAAEDGKGNTAALHDEVDAQNAPDGGYDIWHNGKETKGEGWVAYTWMEPVILEGSDAYYYKDADGSFIPSEVRYEYQDEEGNWQPVINPQGLGVTDNQYNRTTFDKVETNAIRMSMTPALAGCGLVEWKALGQYANEVAKPDTTALEVRIAQAESKTEKEYTHESWEQLQEALANAHEIMKDAFAKQSDVNAARDALKTALDHLVSVGARNLAAEATPSGSADAVGDGGGLAVLNNGIEPEASDITGGDFWHNFGAREEQPGWVAYTWSKPIQLKSSEVYYFSDGGGIKVPQSVTYQYLNDKGEWISLIPAQNPKTELDQYNATEFDSIITTGLRINMEAQELNPPGDPLCGVGIKEWKVYGEYVKEEIAVDKTALDKAIILVQAAIQGESLYTVETWTAYQKNLVHAQNVLEDENADQAAVDTATDELLYSFECMELKPVVDSAMREQLRVLLEYVNTKQKEDYTENSWEALEKAADEVQRVLDNADSLPEEATTAYNNLLAALSGLKEIEIPAAVDKNVLSYAVKSMMKKAKSDYTLESWAAFERALKQAQDILDKESATQEEVNNALALLEISEQQLVQASKPEPKPEPNPEPNPQEQPKQGYWVENASGWWYNNGDDTWTANGWQKIDGVWYAFDENGYMLYDRWMTSQDTWYYLKSNGAMAENEWILQNDTWYYVKDNGVMAAGEWVLVGGIWYYTNGNGAMASEGWVYTNGIWYYVTGNGAMASAQWLSYKDQWYYLKDSGEMAANEWILAGDTWYYLQGDGIMAENRWILSGSDWYYVGNTGAMEADTWIGNYYVDGSGKWVR